MFRLFNFPIIYKDKFILSHEPLHDIGRFVNIHGHVHDKSLDSNKHINVSVEMIGYKPINLDKIIVNYRKE